MPERFRGGHAGHRDGFFAGPSVRAMGTGRDLFALRRDGAEIPVEIGLNPVQAGTSLVVIATLVDITARREAESRAREAEERERQSRKLESLGTLAGGVAHDFNNILLAIVGFTELAAAPGRGQRGREGGPRPGAARRRARPAARAAHPRVQPPRRSGARARASWTRVVREAIALLRASLPATIEMRTRPSTRARRSCSPTRRSSTRCS